MIFNSRIPPPIGEKFGYLTVVEEKPPVILGSGKKNRMILCKCICGTKIVAQLGGVKSGHTNSCGCYAKESTKSRFTKHGLYKHPLYKTWDGMNQRCYNVNDKAYENYGGRGIDIIENWLGDDGIVNFIKWHDSLPLDKQKKKGYEIDRINNDKGYSPKNCRWVPKTTNMYNRRNNIKIVYKNVKYNFLDFLDKFGTIGVTEQIARKRLNRGWSAIDSVTKPKRNYPL